MASKTVLHGVDQSGLSTAKPSNPNDGAVFWCTDTLQLLIYDAATAAWKTAGGMPSGNYALAATTAAVTGNKVWDTGLATVSHMIATLNTAPNISTSTFATVGAGSTSGLVVAYAWKPTAANDVTPIAGTGTVSIGLMAIGPRS